MQNVDNQTMVVTGKHLHSHRYSLGAESSTGSSVVQPRHNQPHQQKHNPTTPSQQHQCETSE
jgi:hypothetical protein